MQKRPDVKGYHYKTEQRVSILFGRIAVGYYVRRCGLLLQTE